MFYALSSVCKVFCCVHTHHLSDVSYPMDSWPWVKKEQNLQNTTVSSCFSSSPFACMFCRTLLCKHSASAEDDLLRDGDYYPLPGGLRWQAELGQWVLEENPSK